MDLWVWAVIILAVGFALAMLEVFVPSGGILGFLCLTSVVASVVLAFKQSPGTGFTFLGVAIVGLPAVFATALHFFPRTPMGRWLMLGVPTSEEVLPDDSDRRKLKELVGKLGVARSVMLPSGRVKIEGRFYDASSEGLPIEAGQSVLVVDVQSGRLIVRPADVAPKTPGRDDDPLARPFDFGTDPFGDSGAAT